MADIAANIPMEENDGPEVYRLMKWASNHTKDWHRICHPEGYHPNIHYLSDLIERLYREKLYTTMYFVISSQNISIDMEDVISKTVNECFLDIPIDTLMARFCHNTNLQAEKALKK